jgi:hypothetical protein
MDQLMVDQEEAEVLHGQIRDEENSDPKTGSCDQIHQDFTDEWDNWHPHFF